MAVDSHEKVKSAATRGSGQEAPRSPDCVTDGPADNPSATEEGTDKAGCHQPWQTALQ
jgi:hypothetical protein